ncbi:MAG TPA: aminotransferase class V-fold PLP-dependent enzyme [Alphaproteobacteria bacterium]|nr:aminotransferase class V-fold PLP-dependent enzyme [Alphaproteobacteria bacterium]
MNKIIYLDAAASSLKSESVIKAEIDFLKNNYANSGRGVCERSIAVDKMVENSRKSVANFIKSGPENIVFTSGTTDGMNRIAKMVSESSSSGNQLTVTVSDLDHHSARMPWEEIGHHSNVDIKVCSLDKDHNIDISGIGKTDVLVITAMSNVLGALQNVKEIIKKARSQNSKVITIVDAAQYVAHLPINVVDWDCDFLCFSGHKIGSDTGLGVMYIKEPNRWYPDKFGGGMVNRINGNEWVLADGPAKFEAGTLPLTQIVGLPYALDYMSKDKNNLIEYMYSELSKMKRIKIITKPDSCILSFVIDNMNCLDFGTLIGAYGVCLRVGNMCASWLHKLMGYNGTIRISVGPWNTKAEADEVIEIIKKILEK